MVDDATGAPYPNLPVDLVLPDGSEERVTTGEDGMIALKAVPPGPVRATLTLEDRNSAPRTDEATEDERGDEPVVAMWSQTEPTATTEVATGTPQVLRMRFPGLSG